MKIGVKSVLAVAILASLGGCGSTSEDGEAGSSSSGSSSQSSSSSSSVSSAASSSSSMQSSSSESNSSSSALAAFTISDTNQTSCYDTDGAEISCEGSGQDGAYVSFASLPDYQTNSDREVVQTQVQSASGSGISVQSIGAYDEIIYESVSGLTWQKDPDKNGDGNVDVDDKMTPSEAISYCDALSLGGYDDWRLPDIKTLYALMDFSGEDVSSYSATDTSTLHPFINTNYFDFAYGDTSAGERIIDSQWATTSDYVSTVFDGAAAMFGVNFADGRIKGYPKVSTFYVRCVRGSESYGKNQFSGNNDGTVTDSVTGLMWEQNDSKEALGWQEAIDYCENDTTGGYTDWRLPNAKNLQSIVDYSRSPDTTGSAAIDSDYFNATEITNEAGQSDYGFYWSSTTHLKSDGPGDAAVYVCFGRAMGYMDGKWMDVHGAGAQRSDPKSTLAIDQSYSTAAAYNGTAVIHGPQGDVVRVENFARCVRDAAE